MDDNPILKRAALETVDNQLRANDPPETRQTLDRLIAAGHSRKEAKELIGSVVLAEIWHVIHDDVEFNLERFVTALNELK
ncbi:MAG: hypothetical protein JXQ72_02165 [Anaerolineae bacterium]|nr:hypothetical protein [Anaerolineae bacterium]